MPAAPMIDSPLHSETRWVHGSVRFSGQDIHLIPHAGPDDHGQIHSLIRLAFVDPADATPDMITSARLRRRLEVESRISGHFLILLVGFCSGGLLDGRLVDWRE